MNHGTAVGAIARLRSAIAETCAKGPDRSSKKIVYPVPRSEYKPLQEFLNEGHQPWRAQAAPVAGQSVCELAYPPSVNCDAYAIPFNENLETVRKGGSVVIV